MFSCQVDSQKVPGRCQLPRAPLRLWRPEPGCKRHPPSHRPLSFHLTPVNHPQNKEKIKYSKWKASDIAKAFRENRTPVPGPAGGLPEPASEDSGVPESADQVTKDEEKELAREFAELERRDRDERPEGEVAEEGEPEAYPFPVLPTAEPSAPPAEEEAMEEEAHTPAFPMFLNTPTTLPGDQSPEAVVTPTAAPVSHQTSELPPPPPHPSFQPPTFPAAVFPPVAPVAPSLPPPPPQPTHTAPAPVAAARAVPSAPAVSAAPIPVDEGAVPTSLEPAAITKIQKHAKWAISALNYDDLVTARKELRAALDMLEGRA